MLAVAMNTFSPFIVVAFLVHCRHCDDGAEETRNKAATVDGEGNASSVSDQDRARMVSG